MAAVVYPVRVKATLDEPLSRWLWLVKWFLAIPHFVVLAFLWMAFAVLSVVAFFAILFTGRYPRAIFDFNVGVLRWTWRVSYYTYGALGTDQYPPFSLDEVPDYPAHLEISYPDHLSRGLVLVKWWLLAIPQYIVVGLFISGAWLAWRFGDSHIAWGGGGLIGILVTVAAVILLVSGQYPKPLYDFVLGMNRWVLRVAAYAALMTDAYPPFRLDMGGDEPGDTLTVPAPAQVPAPTTATPQDRPPVPGRGWTAGRTVSVVVGAVLVLASLGLLGAGGFGTWLDRVQRDASGFVPLGTQTYSSSGYAVSTDSLHVYGVSTGWGAVSSMIGDVRISAESTGPGRTTFVGLAPSGLASGYLHGVAYSTVSRIGSGPTLYVEHLGTAPAVPTTVDIWTASASGPGTQTLVWSPSDGDWTIVALNPDASRGVAVSAQVSAELPALGWVAAGLLVLGLLFLAVGVTMVTVASVRAGRDSPAPQ